MKHFNKLTPAEAKRLAVLIEECSEVQKAACKVLRHGYDSSNPELEGPQSCNSRDLAMEIGDLQAAIKNIIDNADVPKDIVKIQKRAKLKYGTKWMHHQ